MCVNSFSYFNFRDIKYIWFLFHNKGVLVSVLLFHMQPDEDNVSYSYKSIFFKIGDLRNVYNTLRKSPIGRYANHTNKLVNPLLQPLKNILLSYLELKLYLHINKRVLSTCYTKYSFE